MEYNYPLVYALLNGAELDYGNDRSKQFDENARMVEEFIYTVK